MDEFCDDVILPDNAYADEAFISLGLLCAGLGITSGVVHIESKNCFDTYVNDEMVLAMRQHNQRIVSIPIRVDLLYRPQHFDIVHHFHVAARSSSSSFKLGTLTRIPVLSLFNNVMVLNVDRFHLLYRFHAVVSFRTKPRA